MAVAKRGAFIVLEGIDRTGKTTQAKLLQEFLVSKNVPAVSMRFPGTSIRPNAGAKICLIDLKLTFMRNQL